MKPATSKEKPANVRQAFRSELRLFKAAFGITHRQLVNLLMTEYTLGVMKLGATAKEATRLVSREIKAIYPAEGRP